MKRNPAAPAVLLALAALALAAAAPALADDLKGMPGYVDLEWIEIPAHADEIQDIDLGAILLGLAAEAKENDDQALLRALSMIKSVRVKSFSVAERDDESVARSVKKVEDLLAKNDWKRLIYVKDDDETTTVSTRYENDKMVGLMLVTYEPGDSAAFVNVVGDLDLATLLSLVGEFEGDSIEDMLEELEGSGHGKVHVKVERDG